jgi:hypothetical protein
MGVAQSPHNTTVDLLTQAIEQVRPLLTTDASSKERICLLWAAVQTTRDLAASDVIHDAFMALAVEVRLIDKAGRWIGDDVRDSRKVFGARDVAHVIRWALRGRNPFEEGPLT